MALPPSPPALGAPKSFALGARALICGYLAAIAAPLVIGWAVAPPASGPWSATATGLGLVGYAMALAQFVLIGRFRVIGGRVGIDRLMRAHRIAAYILLLGLILHPVLYAAPLLRTSLGEGAAMLAGMFGSPALASGVIALGALMLLVVLAVFRSRIGLRYETWRASHGALALVVALAGLHHALSVGAASTQAPVALLWAGLAAVAVGTLVNTYLLRPLLLRRYAYRVEAVTEAGPARWIVTVALDDGAALPFRAGQFAWVKFGDNPFTLVEHPFSFASAPGSDGRIEFLIREAGDFTSTIGNLAPATPAWIDGPYGAFVLSPPGAPNAPATVVMIAGGVGLAPMLSILREAGENGDPRRFHLIFGNRITAQIVCRDALEALEGRLDLRVDYVLSEPPAGWTGAVGQLDRATIAPLLGDVPADATCYLCGPPPMVASATAALMKLGVPRARMVAERFDYD